MITLWLATGLIAAPQEPARPEVTWPGTFIREGRKYKSFEEIRKDIFGDEVIPPAPVDETSKPIKPATPAEIARAALLEAQRVNAAREEAELARQALAESMRKAKLAAEAARRARDDEEALIAILMAF